MPLALATLDIFKRSYVRFIANDTQGLHYPTHSMIVIRYQVRIPIFPHIKNFHVAANARAESLCVIPVTQLKKYLGMILVGCNFPVKLHISGSTESGPPES